MKKKLLPVGLAMGMLIAALAAGTALATGGDSGPGEAPEEVIFTDADASAESIANDELDLSAPDDLSVRVAELLGTDPQATHDALVSSDVAAEPIEAAQFQPESESTSVHAQGPSYMDYGNSVGAMLGLDGRIVAEAIARAYEELYGIERGIDDHGSGRDKHEVAVEGGKR